MLGWLFYQSRVGLYWPKTSWIKIVFICCCCYYYEDWRSKYIADLFFFLLLRLSLNHTVLSLTKLALSLSFFTSFTKIVSKFIALEWNSNKFHRSYCNMYWVGSILLEAYWNRRHFAWGVKSLFSLLLDMDPQCTKKLRNFSFCLFVVSFEE